MHVDIGTGLFAFGIFAVALRNFELAIVSMVVAVWCLS